MFALTSVPLARKAHWVHEVPEGLLALEKPAGIASHPNRPGERSVVLRPYHPDDQCFLLEGGVRLHLCNRLDSPTSGILLLATEKPMAAWVRQAFRERRVEKTYLAGLKGRTPTDSGIWNDRIHVRKQGGQVRASTHPGGRGDGPPLPVTTRFESVSTASHCGHMTSLVKLYPETGRTHQLRVQTNKRRLPVLGDKTYGDFALNKKLRSQLGLRRLLLHSWKIRLEGNWQDQPFCFQAETAVPEWCRLWTHDLI